MNYVLGNHIKVWITRAISSFQIEPLTSNKQAIHNNKSPTWFLIHLDDGLTGVLHDFILSHQLGSETELLRP